MGTHFDVSMVTTIIVFTILGSMYVSGKMPAYPSPNLTLTLTSCFGQNVRFGEEWVGSFPETDIDPNT